MPTWPEAVTSRAMTASTVWLTTARAREAPTAALTPMASPLAVVVTETDWFAPMVRSPPSVRRGPAPIEARVLALEIVMATTGVTAVPPAAPPVALVSWVPVLFAVRVRSPAPVSAEPSANSATVSWSITFTATDAPTPTFPSTDGSAPGVGAALTLVVRPEPAVSVTPEPLTETFAAGPRLAVVSRGDPTASAPATPGAVEPARTAPPRSCRCPLSAVTATVGGDPECAQKVGEGPRDHDGHRDRDTDARARVAHAVAVGARRWTGCPCLDAEGAGRVDHPAVEEGRRG